MKHILNQSHFESKVREIYHPFQGKSFPTFKLRMIHRKPLKIVYSSNYRQNINLIIKLDGLHQTNRGQN